MRILNKINFLKKNFADCRMYCLIDAAGDKDIISKLQTSDTHYYCLLKKGVHYNGERLLPELAAVAPYLMLCDKGSFPEKFIDENWGKNRIILLFSTCAVYNVINALSDLLLVNEPDGTISYFRFYDPRVLRSFLPECPVEMVGKFFGMIRSFVVERDAFCEPVIFTAEKNSVTLHTISAQLDKIVPLQQIPVHSGGEG